jgi:hypothetical protein
MKLFILVVLALFQLAQACWKVSGKYHPQTGYLTLDVVDNNVRVCSFADTFKGKLDPFWLNCIDGHYSWIKQDMSLFAYAANGADHHVVPYFKYYKPMQEEADIWYNSAGC